MLPFFFLPPVSVLALVLRVVFSLGMVMFSARRCVSQERNGSSHCGPIEGAKGVVVRRMCVGGVGVESRRAQCKHMTRRR